MADPAKLFNPEGQELEVYDPDASAPVQDMTGPLPEDVDQKLHSYPSIDKEVFVKSDGAFESFQPAEGMNFATNFIPKHLANIGEAMYRNIVYGQVKSTAANLDVALGATLREASRVPFLPAQVATMGEELRNTGLAMRLQLKNDLALREMTNPIEGSIDKFIGDVGASMLTTIGLMAITKSPAAVANIYGAMSGLESFAEQQERGKSYAQSISYGMAVGTLTSKLENIGLKSIYGMNWTQQLPIIGRHLLNAIATEGLTEAAQSLVSAGATLAATEGKGMNLLDTISDAIYSFAVGAVSGGLLVGTVAIPQRHRAIRLLQSTGIDKTTATRIVDTVVENPMQDTLRDIKNVNGIDDEFTNRIQSVITAVNGGRPDIIKLASGFGSTTQSEVEKALSAAARIDQGKAEYERRLALARVQAEEEWMARPEAEQVRTFTVPDNARAQIDQEREAIQAESEAAAKADAALGMETPAPVTGPVELNVDRHKDLLDEIAQQTLDAELGGIDTNREEYGLAKRKYRASGLDPELKQFFVGEGKINRTTAANGIKKFLAGTPLESLGENQKKYVEAALKIAERKARQIDIIEKAAAPETDLTTQFNTKESVEGTLRDPNTVVLSPEVTTEQANLIKAVLKERDADVRTKQKAMDKAEKALNMVSQRVMVSTVTTKAEAKSLAKLYNKTKDAHEKATQDYLEALSEFNLLYDNPTIELLDPKEKADYTVKQRVSGIARMVRGITRAAQTSYRSGRVDARKDFAFVRSAIHALVKSTGLTAQQQRSIKSMFSRIDTVDDFLKSQPRIEAEIDNILSQERAKAQLDMIAKIVGVMEGTGTAANPSFNLGPKAQAIANTFLKGYNSKAPDLKAALDGLNSENKQEAAAYLMGVQLATGKDASSGLPLSPEYINGALDTLGRLISAGEKEAFVTTRANEIATEQIGKQILDEILAGKTLPVEPQPGSIGTLLDKWLAMPALFARSFSGNMSLIFRSAGNAIGGSLGEMFGNIDPLLSRFEARTVGFISDLDRALADAFPGVDRYKKLEQDNSRNVADGAVMIDIMQEDAKGNVTVTTVPFSRAELREKVMLYMRPAGQQKMDALGWGTGTETRASAIEQAKAAMTEGDNKYIQSILKIYDQIYQIINPVFKRLKGFDLPKEEFYSNIVFEREAGEVRDPESILDPLIQAVMSDNAREAAGTIDKGFLHATTKATVRLQRISDTAKVTKYIHDAVYFAEMAERMVLLNKTLRNSDIRNAIISRFGDSVYKDIDRMLTVLTRNTIRNEASNVDSAFNRFINRFATGVLSAKPSLFLKQLTSAVVSMMDMGVSEYVKGIDDMVKAISDGRINKFLNHPLIQYRYKMRNNSQEMRFFQEMTEVASGRKVMPEWERVLNNPQFNNIMFLPVQLGDLGGVVGSGWPMFRYLTQTKGMNEEDAMAKTMDYINATQQSGRFNHMSRIMLEDHPLVRIFTRFAGAPTQYINATLKVMDTIGTNKSFKKDADGQIIKDSNGKPVIDWQPFGNAFFVMWILLPMLYNYVSDAFKLNRERAAVSAFLGPFDGTIIVGEILNYMAATFVRGAFKAQEAMSEGASVSEAVSEGAKAATGVRPPDIGLSVGMLNNVKQFMGAVSKSLDDGMSPEEFFDVLVELSEASLPVTGSIGGAVRAGVNALEGVYLGSQGDLATSWRRYLMTLGFSKSATKGSEE